MSVLNEGIGHKEFHIFMCPKCGKTPSVKRSPDPSEIAKRYSIKCSSETCRLNKTVYAPTETMAIVEWNRFASKVVVPKTSSEDFVRS